MTRKFRKNSLTVEFEDANFWHIVKKHLKKQNTETGGILCGSYSEDLSSVKITEVCEPTEDSQFGRSQFIRGIKGLTKKLSQV